MGEVYSVWKVVWQLLQFVFFFALVLFLAYFSSRLLGRRYQFGGGRYIRLIEQLPLGGNRSLWLAEVSDRVLLLGVTDHGITLLSALDRDKELVPPGPSPSGGRSLFMTRGR